MNWRSIWSVVVGILIVGVLSVATDYLLEPYFLFRTMEGVGFLWVAFIYRSIYTILGGYVTARLAPTNPSKHVLILGCIGMFAALVGTVVGWNFSAHWYPIALTVTALPFTWLGGKLHS